MSDIEHRYIQVNGMRMHYVSAGKGPLALLLHGFPQFWYCWRHQIAALARHYTVVAPDQRGYNETDRPAWGYEVDVLVADVVELIQALGHERALLVGHDWGGAVAWATAIAYPQRVERLVVLNTPHPAIFAEQLRTNPRQIMRSAYMGYFTLPGLPELTLRANDFAGFEWAMRGQAPAAFSAADMAIYKAALSRPGALSAALEWYRAAARQGMRGLFSGSGMRVAAPTLMLWGDADLHLGAELVNGTGRFVADLSIRFLHGISHWAQEQAPEQVNRHLLEWLGHPDEPLGR